MLISVAKRDLEVSKMKRKSSCGMVESSTFGHNLSLADFGKTNFKLQTSGTMLGLANNRNLSMILAQ